MNTFDVGLFGSLIKANLDPNNQSIIPCEVRLKDSMFKVYDKRKKDNLF